MNRDIPGYYYDPVKKKYFKVEKSNTAPPSASWSSDAVKKRKLEHHADQTAKQRAKLVRKHIRRHALTQNVVSTSLLTQQMGLSRVAEFGKGCLDTRDVGADAWANGVVAKGHVPFAPSFARNQSPNVPCFYVNGDDEKTGMGAVYATLDESSLVGCYMPTDDNDTICFSTDRNYATGRSLAFRREAIQIPGLSSIKYHAPSHKMLLTSRDADRHCALVTFSPPLSDPSSDQPHWGLGNTFPFERSILHESKAGQWHVYGCTPAPVGAGMVCLLGTNHGPVAVRENLHMDRITTLEGRAKYGDKDSPRETFAQDFRQGHPKTIIAGGRQPRVWIKDVRTPSSTWDTFSHTSSVAHLRSVNEHHVLVAGLRNSMAVYDLRALPRKYRPSRPLLTFPDYRNEAYFHIGWDVCPSLNVVAAAHDDGTVKLFSMTSGRRLRCAALETVRASSPIKALMFERMPRERMPSLFVGEGPSVKKYSFGVEQLEDEA